LLYLRKPIIYLSRTNTKTDQTHFLTGLSIT
jgi:hypothetical protein